MALGEAARAAPSAVSDEIGAGVQRLREVVAAYHRRVRPGNPKAEHVVVVAGFRQGLVLPWPHSGMRECGSAVEHLSNRR